MSDSNSRVGDEETRRRRKSRTKVCSFEHLVLILFSYVKGGFVNLADYSKQKKMEDFMRKEL